MAVHRIGRGLDLPLAGAPEHVIDAGAAPARVALVAADYVGLKPTMLVQAGDACGAASRCSKTRRTPGVRLHRARGRDGRGDPPRRAARPPVAGHRRRRRRRPRGAGRVRRLPRAPRRALDSSGVRALLLESGLWTRIPHAAVQPRAAPDATPHAMFVTAIDTHPHAPPVGRGHWPAARPTSTRGLRCVAKLTDGPVLRVQGGGLGRPHVRPPARPARGVRRPASGRDGRPAHPLARPGQPDAHGLAHRLPGRDRDRPAVRDRPARRRARDLAGRARRRAAAAAADPARRRDRRPGRAASSRPASSASSRARCSPGAPRRARCTATSGRYHLQVAVAARRAASASCSAGFAPGADKFSIWGVVLGALAQARSASR